MTNVPKTTKMIYDKLQDNESRMIFKHRLLFFLDRDFQHLFDMNAEISKIEKALFPRRPHQLDLIEEIKQSGKMIVFFCDKPIQNIQVVKYLKYLGLNINLYCPIEDNISVPIKSKFNLVHPEELNTTYKNAVFLCVMRLVDRVKGFCEKYSANLDNILVLGLSAHRRNYFGLNCMLPEENEVFVDAGVCNGDTIERFINWSKKGYKKAYGFECDPDNIKKTETRLNEKNFRDVELIRKGVWSEETVLRFHSKGSASTINQEGSIEVPVTSIDSVVGDERVTFIKMDIEGAELEALKGARNCIAKHSPKLAICVYHKPEDILTIPEIILDINPEYSFYLRHHTIGTALETVLYGIIKNKEKTL